MHVMHFMHVKHFKDSRLRVAFNSMGTRMPRMVLIESMAIRAHPLDPCHPCSILDDAPPVCSTRECSHLFTSVKLPTTDCMSHPRDLPPVVSANPPAGNRPLRLLLLNRQSETLARPMFVKLGDFKKWTTWQPGNWVSFSSAWCPSASPSLASAPAQPSYRPINTPANPPGSRGRPNRAPSGQSSASN